MQFPNHLPSAEPRPRGGEGAAAPRDPLVLHLQLHRHGQARVQGAGCRVQGSGFRVQGVGFRVRISGFRVQGAGFRVQGVAALRDPLVLHLRLHRHGQAPTHTLFPKRL